ncbi:MAG TPA: type II toxin-antitoxin system Phd/YefM family antitoxin [Thermodesulfobacteriota bacterium]|nr:type II toxin-antitoxin system Phd/YefM family antitoxin [Thermodesulfobacteriota bacterium]
MKIYTYTQARQNFASLLEQARREGAVGIRRRDGQTFILKPVPITGSPLDVEGVDIGITAEEIVSFVHEGRRESQEDR